MTLGRAKYLYFWAMCFRSKILPQPIYNDAKSVTIAFNRVQHGTAGVEDEWLLEAALAYRYGWRPHGKGNS